MLLFVFHLAFGARRYVAHAPVCVLVLRGPAQFRFRSPCQECQSVQSFTGVCQGLRRRSVVQSVVWVALVLRALLLSDRCVIDLVVELFCWR